MYNTLWPFGAFIAGWVTFGTFKIQSSWAWRIPSAVQGVPSAVQVFLLPFAPESPRWLIDHGHEEEALEILADLHAHGNKDDSLVQLEYEEIRQQVYFEKQDGAKSYLDLFKPGIMRRVMLGTSLQMWRFVPFHDIFSGQL